MAIDGSILFLEGYEADRLIWLNKIMVTSNGGGSTGADLSRPSLTRQIASLPSSARDGQPGKRCVKRVGFSRNVRFGGWNHGRNDYTETMSVKVGNRHIGCVRGNQSLWACPEAPRGRSSGRRDPGR